MISFMLLPENLPFAVALVVMFGIAALEGVLTLLGAGLSNLIDSILPDSLNVDPQVDAHPEAMDMHHLGLSDVLGWMFVGKVPSLILLVVFLTAFGLSGYVMQGVVHGVTGGLIPAWIAWLPATVLSLYPTRWSAGFISKYMPRDESSAVSADSLIGRVATIVIGTAKVGQPAQARLKDEHGLTHYVMVEPDLDGEAFTAGSPVLLVRRAGHLFKGIVPPNPALLNEAGNN